MRDPFPFPPLLEGDVTLNPGTGDRQELLQMDCRIVRWFVEKAGWTNRPIPLDSTLGEFLSISEKIDLNASSKTVEEIERETARHLLHLAAALSRLAWAIRALHARPGCIESIDASFINSEILGADDSRQGVARRLPAGIGTIVFAGRLLQAGGGRIVSIKGHRGVGHDIKWVSDGGDVVYVERKDRAYEAGLADTSEKRVAKVVNETREAGLSLPRERGAVRVLVVGFQHLVYREALEDTNRVYAEALQREFGGWRVLSSELPDFVVVEHLGLEPRTGGEKIDSFMPFILQPLPRSEMRRVGPKLLKAIGG